MDNWIKTKYAGNVSKYYWLIILVSFTSFYNETLIIYMQHFGLSYLQISIVTITMFILAFILEVPSGAFADLYGRKKSVLIAVVSIFSSVTTLAFASRFETFLLASAFMGISLAFSSGAVEALIFDSLKKIGREKEYMKVQSRSIGYGIVVGMISAFFGPLTYSINVRLPYYISAVAAFFVVFVPLIFFEQIPERKSGSLLKEHYNQIMNGFRFSFNNKPLLWLIGFTTIFSFANIIVGQLIMGPYILSRGFSIKEMGFVTLISTFLQTIITFNGDKIENRLGEKKTLFFISIFSILLLGAFAIIQTKTYLVGVIFGLFWGTLTFSSIVLSTYLNKHLKRGNRATVLSVASMMGIMVAVPFTPIMGVLFDATSITYGIVVLGIFMAVVLIVLYLVRPKNSIKNMNFNER